MTTCSLEFPPQINLARLPTPMQPLRRSSEKYGVELYVKRDDLTGTALSGNKIRKLEFVLADALAKKSDLPAEIFGSGGMGLRPGLIAFAVQQFAIALETDYQLRKVLLCFGRPDAVTYAVFCCKFYFF